MGQEEHQRSGNTNSSCGGSGGGGGGRLSKKQKQKKIPQRGLGVAQLEKIRLEELQKKNDAPATPGPVGSSPPVSVPLLPRHSHIQSSSSIPFRLPMPSYDVFGVSSTTPPPPPPAPGQLIGYSGGGGRHSYFPSIVNSSEVSYDRELPKSNHGLMLQTHFRNNFSSVGPYNVIRHNHHQQNQIYTSKVNVSSTISSGVNLPIEFPSNQSYHSNNYRLHPWPEDEKIVGMKRPWPFFVDNQESLTPNFRSNFPPVAPLDTPIFRESSSGFAPHQFDWRTNLPEFKLKIGSTENGALDAGLTLGLPTPTSPPTTKAKDISCQEVPNHQEYIGESVRSSGVYSFFPPKTQQIDANSDNRRSGIRDCLDLSLKL